MDRLLPSRIVASSAEESYTGLRVADLAPALAHARAHAPTALPYHSRIFCLPALLVLANHNL